MGVPSRGIRRATTPRPKPIIVARQDDERLSPRPARPDPRRDAEHDGRRHQGYEKKLESVGVGYLAAVQGQTLQLRVGLANEMQVPIPAGLKVTCPDQQHIVIKGIDKQMVGQFAAEVRAVRKPEPYKGKGIRYMGEVVRRKQGKAMVK